MTDHAAREAAPFLHPGETVLPDDYPVYAGYAYVVESKEGEVWVSTACVSGSVADMKRDLARHLPGKPVRHVRRCNLVSRMTEPRD